VVRQLTKATRLDTAKGWEWFRRQRPKAADATAVYFTSFSFDCLKRSVRNLPVGTLHVSTRAATALARAKITTLEDLIDAAIRGLVKPRPGGAKTCREIIEMLDALSRAVEENGDCDWGRYAHSRQIMLFPRKVNGGFAATEYLKEFPAVIHAAVLTGFGRPRAVLARELLLRVGCGASQDKLATQFAVTRQEIGRLRDLMLQKLQAALLRADYAGCRFRFRPEFVRPLEELAWELSNATGRAVACSEWRRILRNCWCTTPDCLGASERFLLELLGFQKVTFKQPRFRAIILPFDRKTSPFRRAVAKAERLLTREFAAGLSKAELFDELKKDANVTQLRQADIKAIMEALPGIRPGKLSGFYECRPRNLKTLGDRLERALRNIGKVAHFRRLAALVNRVPPTVRKANERSVVNVLSADKRFKSVARTGLWALAEWGNVETRTVAELARVFLTQHNRSATETELFEFISPLRKVAKESIRTELERDFRFSRVAPRTWDLTNGDHHQ